LLPAATLKPHYRLLLPFLLARMRSLNLPFQHGHNLTQQTNTILHPTTQRWCSMCAIEHKYPVLALDDAVVVLVVLIVLVAIVVGISVIVGKHLSHSAPC